MVFVKSTPTYCYQHKFRNLAKIPQPQKSNYQNSRKSQKNVYARTVLKNCEVFLEYTCEFSS